MPKKYTLQELRDKLDNLEGNGYPYGDVFATQLWVRNFLDWLEKEEKKYTITEMRDGLDKLEGDGYPYKNVFPTQLWGSRFFDWLEEQENSSECPLEKVEKKLPLEEIIKIIDDLQESYDWGGGEDEDGGLSPGSPDFLAAKEKIEKILTPSSKKAEKET